MIYIYISSYMGPLYKFLLRAPKCQDRPCQYGRGTAWPRKGWSGLGSARPEASTAARAAQALGTGVTREAGVEPGRAARRAGAGWPGARVLNN
jgi:hypothetical protein